MGHKTEIELMDSKFFDNKTFYRNDNIIISKQEIKKPFKIQILIRSREFDN